MPGDSSKRRPIEASVTLHQIAQVVNSGICVGCGACASVDANLTMRFDDCGRYVVIKSRDGVDTKSIAAKVCPFADGVPSEDDLSLELFGPTGSRSVEAGFYVANFVGWVEEGDYRKRGSSGGMATWLCCELFRLGLIDGVIHVTENNTGDGALFRYRVSENADQVREGAKSRYYPVEMSDVLRQMRTKPGRYAVVGVPCFIKALRLVAREVPEIRDRLQFAIGIVCGHLKSKAFGDLLAWQCGILPNDLRSIDFRSKLADRPASKYGVTACGQSHGDVIQVTRPMQGLLGADWGQGLFKYKACDFCDDVLAETADIVFGDAWLPEYERDSRGSNVVVVRRREIVGLLRDAAMAGRIHLDEVPVSKIVQSQAGGFRHRRDGLAYRLWLEDKAGRWRPKKRLEPSRSHLNRKLRRVYRLRFNIAQTSHAAFAEAKQQGDLAHFVRKMDPLMRRYRREYSRALLVRAWRKLQRIFTRSK